MKTPVLRGDRLGPSDRCQCGACGDYFKTSEAFDRHRTGKYGVSRRCHDRDGMHRAGLIREDGFWRVWKPLSESSRPENTPIISAKKHPSPNAGAEIAPESARSLPPTRRAA